MVVNGTDEAFNPFEFVDFTADEMCSVFEVINLFNDEVSSGVEGMSHEAIMPAGDYNITHNASVVAANHLSEIQQADSGIPISATTGQLSGILQLLLILMLLMWYDSMCCGCSA